MAEQPQTIVDTIPPSDKPLGTRNESNLTKIFGSSPLPGYLAEMSDEERKALYEAEALNGVVLNGLGFNSFDRDYTDAPNLVDVATGGGGLPSTPFTPNPTSPGPGVVTADAIPEYTGDTQVDDDGIPTTKPEYGSGLGGTTSPSTTSSEIAGQTLGDLILGPAGGISKSYAGSQGAE
jgi:hypothetical protein